MLIRLLHWVARDVLPDKMWVRWLRWRYQRENQQAEDAECRFYRLGYGATCTCTRCIKRRSAEPRRAPDYIPMPMILQSEVYDCGCPVARSASGRPARQFHDADCEHSSPYHKGGIIRVDRDLIPHRPGRGICDCAACNPSGAMFTC